jgi:hypothetical protein
VKPRRVSKDPLKQHASSPDLDPTGKPRKSKKRIYQEIMAKSKAARAERKRTKANYLTMLEELDNDFLESRHLFQPMLRTDLRKNAIVDPEDAADEKLVEALDALPRVPGDEWRRGQADAVRANAAATAGDARLTRVRDERRRRRAEEKAAARRRPGGGGGGGGGGDDSAGGGESEVGSLGESY